MYSVYVNLQVHERTHCIYSESLWSIVKHNWHLTWQSGTLGLPLLQTTTQVCPGNDWEQYPGKPGHVFWHSAEPTTEIAQIINQLHFSLIICCSI